MRKGEYKRVSKICERCGKEFQVIESRKDTARFCSPKCQNKIPWNKGITGEKSHTFGFRHSEETKLKLSKINTGKIMSDEVKKKLSDINKEKYKKGLLKFHPPKKIRTGNNKKIMINRVRKRESHWKWLEYYGFLPEKGMVIHHINGNENDNSKDNLKLMDRKEHIKEHWRIK